jgi:hypothetical protein
VVADRKNEGVVAWSCWPAPPESTNRTRAPTLPLINQLGRDRSGVALGRTCAEFVVATAADHGDASKCLGLVVPLASCTHQHVIAGGAPGVRSLALRIVGDEETSAGPASKVLADETRLVKPCLPHSTG